MGTAKRWFNRRYPYYRLCIVHWCWRGQVYEAMCAKHNFEYSKEL